MSKNEISIELDMPPLELKRENDKYLMQEFKCHGATPKQLKYLNKYRLFLNVCTVSDLVCAKGTTILGNVWIEVIKMMEGEPITIGRIEVNLRRECGVLR